jgi:hydrogenase expression/formation protein
MDLEGFTKQLLAAGHPDAEIRRKLFDIYRVYKDLPDSHLHQLIDAVITECKQSLISSDSVKNLIIREVLQIPMSGVSMGEQGVGCRGYGDFFVHDLISKLSKTNVQPLLSPESLDDTGAVELISDSQSNPNPQRTIILSKMEGMHSRLSDFPFLAGFHVTRAALRDIYVKGGNPISLMVDLHLADDGDVGKLFDFQAGVAAVAELAGVPITAGSTLRIGGDMVIGTRLTGGIAAVGIAHRDLFRRNIRVGDAIMMTEGAGGGTIVTTALYHNMPELIQETLNIKFLHACRTLLADPEIMVHIHSMTDVTNGGLRGDLYEINREANVGVKIYPDRVKSLVNPKVFDMLHRTNVDFLGVSLDALLIYCDPLIVPAIQRLLQQQNIACEQIGYVISDLQVRFVHPTGEETIEPRFRESPYTQIKQVVDITASSNEKREEQIRAAFVQAQEKKKKIIEYIHKQS